MSDFWTWALMSGLMGGEPKGREERRRGRG